jgi:hypothetical protein
MSLFQRTRLSWWQKSRLLSLCGVAIVVALLLVVSLVLRTPPTDENVGRLSALMMSIIPLFVVFSIAVFARVSEYINLKSGGQTAQQEHNSLAGRK